MKKLFFVGVFLSLAGIVTAQSGEKFLKDAYGAYQNKYYDRAKTAIDKCIGYDDTKADAKTWFYRGNIYVMIEYMKTQPDSLRYKDLCSNCAEIAFDAYTQAGLLDPKLLDPKVEPSSMNVIKFIREGMKYCSEMLVIDAFNAVKKEDYELAYRFAKKAFTADKSNTNAIFYAGYTAERMEKYDEAKTHYLSLTKKGYKNIDPYVYLSNIYRNENDTVRAVKIMQEGMPLFLQDDTTFNIKYAEAYAIVMSWAGKSEEASKIMDKALQKDPANYVILINYGLKLVDAKNYEEGEIYLKRAVELNPKDVSANYNLAYCYLYKSADKAKEASRASDDELYEKLKAEEKSLLETAQPYAEKAYELDPNDEGTMKLLQEIYVRSGITNAKVKEIDEKLKILKEK